jgi:hypothetical protein
MEFIHNLKNKFISFVKNNPIKSFYNKIKHIPAIGHELLKDFPPHVKRFIEKYGSTPITKLFVFRYPIPSFIDKVMKILTFGKWDQVKRQFGYDQLYHLGLIANDEIILEKNQILNIAHHKPNQNEQQDTINITIKEPITIRSLIDKAVDAVGKRIFEYNAFSSNCQDFILQLLKHSGLLTIQAKDFILQPFDELIKHLPEYIPKIAKAATDTAGIGQVIHQHLI